MAVERDLNELLRELGVTDAARVQVRTAPAESIEADDDSAYIWSADSGVVEIAISEREGEVLLQAGAAAGGTRPSTAE